MFGLFKKKTPGVVTVTLNARLQPKDRHDLEDAFADVCAEQKFGAEIVGGGTMQAQNGEIELCDIEVRLDDLSDKNIEFVKNLFAAMLAPKGSYLTVQDRPGRIEFGAHEGLGLYLNGTDLPPEVYAQSDVNHVVEECERLLKGMAMVNSHWEGPDETALYMYGESFEAIRAAIAPFTDTYPLCQKARIVRIA